MKLIIFNINIYSLCEDRANIYDNFFQEKKGNNPERYNFSDYNGFCYGYANLKNGKLDLLKANFTNDNSVFTDNATIAWVYEKEGKYFLLGWYKNASVYNFLQKKISYSSVGRDLYYNVKTQSSSCYLLPEKDATLHIDIKFKDNLFYIVDKNDALYLYILEYINNYKGNFANLCIKNIINNTIPNPPDNPLLLFKRGYIYLYEENNFLEALKYFNTALFFKDKLKKEHIIDLHYFKAVSLQYLYSFKHAIDEYKKVLAFTGYDLNIYKNLVYLYLADNDNVNAISYCDEILKKDTTIHIDTKLFDEINCLKIDCLLNLERYNDAKKIIKNIISLSIDENIKNHCKRVLNAIINA